MGSTTPETGSGPSDPADLRELGDPRDHHGRHRAEDRPTIDADSPMARVDQLLRSHAFSSRARSQVTDR